jgi:hypothetical protein
MKAFSVLSGLCIVGAVLLAAMDKDAAQVAALLGLAGTLAGRGKNA